jgi:hypothetical protein
MNAEYDTPEERQKRIEKRKLLFSQIDTLNSAIANEDILKLTQSVRGELEERANKNVALLGECSRSV